LNLNGLIDKGPIMKLESETPPDIEASKQKAKLSRPLTCFE
jgi:hypothetical protein